MTFDEVPVTAFPRCLVCGEPTRPSARNLHEIAGFERDRDAGGTNHVIARRRTGRIVCSTCAPRVQSGVPVAQETLL